MSLVSVILPIVIMVGGGYLLARRTPVETQSLSRVTVYLLTPSLVFTALVGTDFHAAEALRLVMLVLVHYVVLLVIAALTGRLLRLPRVERSGLTLATALYNAGNYGLPVSLFAFGQEGFRLATVVYVVSAILTHSHGIYIASAGRNTPWRAAADIFRLPLVYAVVLGVALQATGWTVPAALWRPLELMAQGAVPVLLIALGVQLGQAGPAALTGPLSVAVLLRLVASPLVAAALAPWFGIGGLAARVAILSTAMPSAINAFLLAAQFDAAPAFVAGAVFLTTVASFASVSVVLLLLQW